MKERRILNILGQVNEEYIEEATPINRTFDTQTIKFNRRLPIALIAAILALLLMGAGVVVAIYGHSIQSWFSYYWEEITGQPMSEEQVAVINQLSQKIDVSETIDYVTVTVNSATIGDDSFFLLLRIEGLQQSRGGCCFEQYSMEINPEPDLKDAGIGSFGYQYLGRDGDGAILLLMSYTYTSKNGYMINSNSIDVQLKLKNIIQNAYSNNLLAAGEWNFNFTLDRDQMPEAIMLPDTEIELMDLKAQKEVPTVLTDIELTATGLHFRFADPERILSFEADISVILKNGHTLSTSDGGGTLSDDKKTWINSFHWEIPINPIEVEAIQIGNSQIAIP